MTADGDSILDWSARAIASAVNRGELSAAEVVEPFLRRIEAHADSHAFITTCPDRALRRAARRPSGPLAGVPLAVKDMFDTAGLRTTYGSSIFRDHVPTRTAAAVRRLERAGAIMVGKANQHEFAFGVTSQNPHWGTVANPAHPGRVAGGSSGGTAAAVAGRLAVIGLGTDTGGSLRIPAACCDVIGYKPAPGLVPTQGVFPLAPSYDTVGPMARSVADAVLVHSVLAGREVPRPRIVGVRVGVLEETGAEDELAALGALVERAALPDLDPDLMAVFTAETAITHVRWFPRRRDEYGPDLRQKLDAAQETRAVDYYRGIIALRDLRTRAPQGLPFDVIACPTLAIETPPADCWEPDVRIGMTANTRPFNFLGWPAIAIGNLHLAGPDEETVLGVALAWAEAHPGPGALQS
jgi:aspartyl-tRNA(Asn)/glutamyl-tRNA(Gln) amidotransferase subunit A